jgi:hypothetical protein
MNYEEVRELLMQDLALMGDQRTYLASLLRGELYQVYKERDRYRIALETINDVLSCLPVEFMGVCGDEQTGKTWPCSAELFDTINTALECENRND